MSVVLLIAAVSVFTFFVVKNMSITFLRISISAATTFLLASCAALYNSTTRPFGITGVQPEERTNGYVFKIEAAGKTGKVEEWIGPHNWLYMSIPDAGIDAGELNDLVKCPIVS